MWAVGWEDNLPIFVSRLIVMAMKEWNFRAVSVGVVLALALLVAVEAMWSVRTYREMRAGYEQQIESILEEAVWRYATPSMGGDAIINIGNISRFHAFVGEGLRTAGLDTEYRVEVLSTTDAAPIVIMAMGEVPDDEDIVSVDRSFAPLILRLKVEDPHATILQSMQRMLILQIVSVLVLITTFVYLLRTLFKAKEVDRIRRDLTHNITHELKTPIAAAYAVNETLRSRPAIAEDNTARNEYLDMSMGELRRLNSMVEEILRSATEEFATTELRLEECTVDEIVAEIRSTLDVTYTSRDVEWCVQVDEDCAVVADRFHLKGALMAIVDNAIKYSSEHPVVSIKASVDRGFTTITIEDNGIGISRRDQRHIFKKFYRAKAAEGYATSGYGIGLYYTRGVVKRHGGTIDLLSAPGRGTCFTVRFPRYGK